MGKIFPFSIVARAIVAALLLWALAHHPHGYYTLLRWVTFGVVAHSTFIAIKIEKIGWAWTLGITALIFNPFFPVHFGREIWAVVDIAAGILLVTSIFFVRER